MSTIVLTPPKDLDLTELFGLRVMMVPGVNGEAGSIAFKYKDVMIGTPRVDWLGYGNIRPNGLIAIWPNRKREFVGFDHGWMPSMYAGDTLSVSLRWNI